MILVRFVQIKMYWVKQTNHIVVHQSRDEDHASARSSCWRAATSSVSSTWDEILLLPPRRRCPSWNASQNYTYGRKHPQHLTFDLLITWVLSTLRRQHSHQVWRLSGYVFINYVTFHAWDLWGLWLWHLNLQMARTVILAMANLSNVFELSICEGCDFDISTSKWQGQLYLPWQTWAMYLNFLFVRVVTLTSQPPNGKDSYSCYGKPEQCISTFCDFPLLTH